MLFNTSWAAGYFEGEGCVYVVTKNGRSKTIELSVAQATKDSSVVPKDLQRFHKEVGVGTIYGPYYHGKRRNPVYVWRASNKQGRTAISRLYPNLTEGAPKMEKIKNLIENKSFAKSEECVVQGKEYSV